MGIKILWISFSAIIGVITALVYIFWLSSTTGKLKSSSNPVVFAVGFFGRILFCVIIFIGIAYGNHFDRLIACVTGFFITHTLSLVLKRFYDPDKREGE